MVYMPPCTLFVGSVASRCVHCPRVYVRCVRYVHGWLCGMCRFDREVEGGWDLPSGPPERGEKGGFSPVLTCFIGF